MWLLLAWLFLTAPDLPAPQVTSWKSLSVVRQGVDGLRVAGTRTVLEVAGTLEVGEWKLPLQGRRLVAFDGASLALSRGPTVEWWDVKTRRMILSRSYGELRWVGLGRGRLLVVSHGLWLHVVDPRGSERRVQLEDAAFRRTYDPVVQMLVLSGDHGTVLYNLIYDGGSRLVRLDLNSQVATRLSGTGPGDFDDYYLSQDGVYVASESHEHPGDAGCSLRSFHETLEFGPVLLVCAPVEGLFDAGGGLLAYGQPDTLELLDLRQGTLRRYTEVPALKAVGVSDQGEAFALTRDGSLYQLPRQR